MKIYAQMLVYISQMVQYFSSFDGFMDETVWGKDETSLVTSSCPAVTITAMMRFRSFEL